MPPPPPRTEFLDFDLESQAQNAWGRGWRRGDNDGMQAEFFELYVEGGGYLTTTATLFVRQIGQRGWGASWWEVFS